MGVAVEVEAEVADVLGAVMGLHLGAQHHLVDDLAVWAAAHLLQEAVEAVGARRLALVPGHAQGGQEVAQVLQLLQAGGVVHPVDQRTALLLQGLGGADIGLHHHLLDQLVRLQRHARRDRSHLTLGVDDDAPLGAVDVQGRAAVAAQLHGAVGGPERIQDPVHQGAGGVVWLAVDGGLGLLVGQLGRRAHQAALEAVTQLAALFVEHHAHGQAGARLARAQAAQAVGQALGQHGLDPVREIDAVALVARVAVQGRAWAHIGGDVGYGHPHHMAAGVAGVVVGLGEDGVVVVAGVGRVDGDQRHGAQVGAAGQGGRLGGLGFGLGAGREAGGDAMLVDGDQRGGARLVLAADHLQHLAAARTIAAIGSADGGQHQVAILQVMRLGLGQAQAFLGLAVHRLDANFTARLAHHAQDLVGALAQALDQLGFDGPILQGLEPHQQPVAQAWRPAGLGLVRAGGQAHGGDVVAALGQAHIEVAVCVAFGHVGHAHGREVAGAGHALAPAPHQGALGLQGADHLAQGSPLGALQPEGQGHIPAVGLAALAQEGQQGVAVGQPLSRAGGLGPLGRSGLGHRRRPKPVRRSRGGAMRGLAVRPRAGLGSRP